jgi:hypothetical protein
LPSDTVNNPWPIGTFLTSVTETSFYPWLLISIVSRFIRLRLLCGLLIFGGEKRYSNGVSLFSNRPRLLSIVTQNPVPVQNAMTRLRCNFPPPRP